MAETADQSVDKVQIESWLKGLQDRICEGLEKLDGQARFKEDLWERSEGGGGRTRVIQDGQLLAKGGVNFSAVHGPCSERMLQVLKIPHDKAEPIDFFATGVSIVLHPHSPMVPIIHMNVRYFELSNGIFWFGGGIDLTPHYVDEALAGAFHRQLKSVCDQHDPNYYPEFKSWADRYFYVKHREETRGIGGIFFDRLQADEQHSKAERWAFVQDVGDAFVPAYQEQVEATRRKAFGRREKAWQALRRGRYVEFNLVLDRGTKFGLETQGRIESILMSMPPTADWAYNWQGETGSAEAKTQALLRQNINWIEH